MGNFWKDSEFSREQVLNDIEKTNEIVHNHLFIERTNLNLIFLLDDGNIFDRKSKKIILAKIFLMNPQTQQLKLKENRRIQINEFYKFFNSLMNCLPIFYNEKIKEKIKNKQNDNKNDINNDEEDNTICPICDEFKVSQQLRCGHFFCQKCIKTWVLSKSESCPMCRCKLDVDKNKGNIKDSAIWDVVDNSNVNKNEMESENQEIFLQITGKLFS